MIVKQGQTVHHSASNTKRELMQGEEQERKNKYRVKDEANRNIELGKQVKIPYGGSADRQNYS